MHLKNCLTVVLLIALGIASVPSLRAADDARRKDPSSLISAMRAKQLGKNLGLSEDQQKKLQELFDEEAKQVAAIQNDTNGGINEKYEKQMAVRKQTEQKIPTLLTDQQKTKYAEMKAKAASKKKKSAAPAATPAKE